MKYIQHSLSEEPRYSHDCPSCWYLGRDGDFDLYFCPVEATIVAREGSDESDYSSGIGSTYNEGIFRMMKVAVEFLSRVSYEFGQDWTED